MRQMQKLITLTLTASLMILLAAGVPCMAGDKSEMPSKADFVKVEAQPEMLKQVNPEYPAEARKKGIEGKVMISTLVDKAGLPAKVEISKSSGNKILDEAALKAAQQAKFKPATQEGKPVAVWVSYAITFKLDDTKDSDEQEP